MTLSLSRTFLNIPTPQWVINTPLAQLSTLELCHEIKGYIDQCVSKYDCRVPPVPIHTHKFMICHVIFHLLVLLLTTQHRSCFHFTLGLKTHDQYLSGSIGGSPSSHFIQGIHPLPFLFSTNHPYQSILFSAQQQVRVRFNKLLLLIIDDMEHHFFSCVV